MAFLDGDDSWHEDYLSSVWRSLIRSDRIGGPTCDDGVSGRIQLLPMKRLGIRMNIRGGPANVIIAMLAQMLPSSTVMRRAAFEELGDSMPKTVVYIPRRLLYLKMLLRTVWRSTTVAHDSL